MGKRFTLLIAVTVLLLGTSNKVLGQTYWDSSGPMTNADRDRTYGIQAGSFSPENNYGPGEAGTVTPQTSGNSTNTGFWGGTISQGFAAGNGIITIGGTPNIVQNVTNKTHQTEGCSGSNGCASVSHSITVTAPGAPGVPDGTGKVSYTGSPVAYSHETHIKVLATTATYNKTSLVPWALQMFHFMENPWYYNNYTISAVATVNHSHTESCHESYTSSGGGTHWHWVNRTATCSHPGINYSRSNQLGGHVPGKIELMAGSHVRLTGATSIHATTPHSSTVTTLVLPATHYTLMNDGNVDEVSIATNGSISWGVGTQLGVNAVLGINGNYIPATNIITNPSGGTILLGTNTGGQGNIKITPPTGAQSVGKTFSNSGQVYTNSYYRHTAANVGNYGDNDVLITHSASMFSTTGNAGLQIFNQNGCYNLTFDAASNLSISVLAGNLLIDALGTTTFNNTSTFGAATTGHTTIRGGEYVRFNAAHTYNGSGAGDYWVQATGLCTPGDIIASAAAPVVVENIGTGTGDLKWEAKRNIHTGATVEFTSTSSTQVDWIAHDNNIQTDEDVTFDHSGSGTTTWNAGKDILTNDDIDFDNSGTGKTTWLAGQDIKTTGGTKTNQIDFAITGNAATEWKAGRDIITTDQNILFDMNANVAKLTNWLAGDSIISFGCSNTTEFKHIGTGDIKWEATTGNISMWPNIVFTKTNASNGYTEWKAGRDINTHNNVTFTSNANTTNGRGNTKWEAARNINVNEACAPGKTIAFTNNSTADDYMWWYAGQSINIDGTSNAQRITVNFLNKAVGQDNHGTNYMKWQANTGNIDVDFADVTFTTDNNSPGYTEWYAGNSILMDYSKVDLFNNAITGNHNDDILWHAVAGDINAGNTPITFNNTGSGYTHWKAGHDILLHDQSPVKINNAATTNWLKFEAGRDIRTGINSPMLIDHKSPNATSGLAANITAWAGRNIWTESSVDILNDGIQNQTWLYAGQDIRIDSTLTFTATNPAGVDWVRMRANSGDIIVNTRTADIQHPDPIGFNAINDVCDARRAAVNFTLLGAASAGSTEWWAGKNIISNDTIHFHYDNTAHTVQDLWLHADVENIDLRRIMKIDFDSDSLIRWEALTQNNPARRQNKHFIDGGVSYNGTQHVNIGQFGNIRTSDSIIINRTYSGTVAGVTQIDAYNDIQTAMFNYTSANTVGDLTDITSRMGDIWLGYSWENPAACTTNNLHSPVSFDLNRFVYRVPATGSGKLNIKAGYDDNGTDKYGGGNIYFTHIVDSLGRGGYYDTEISIPYSNMFTCNTSVSPVLGGIDYERAGIIGGVWRCQIKGISPKKCDTIGFTHVGNNGNLLVDAGLRGNIIFNNGAFLNFQEGTGNAEFRTRWGDIDMRYPFDADTMRGSLLFLASSDLPNKTTPNFCSCEEMRNNVYLQDFEYTPSVNSGSVFVGADNNIKLQYGGLKNIDTKRDPFWSDNAGYPCDSTFHCDADTAENNARDLILNFYQNASNANIVSGGFAAVASDRIDTYKNMIYNGGNGSGLSSVPKYGTLHGETVAGYGLYIKTQGDKKNWTMSDHDVNNTPDPWVGAACLDDPCTTDFLHNIARVTFHADARIYAENQIAFISSPVIETYGNADYNTSLRSGSKTSIRLQADSLIYHDSLIIDGPKTTFSTWSGLYRDMPIIRLGHQRFTPPAAEDNGYCAPCYVHPKDTRNAGGTPFLDTVFVTFRNDASISRLHTLVAEHAVISFLTDSFDHVRGNPTLNAKFYTDTFKIRNHVELFRTADHTHDGHFELISEEQMESKDYAGIYSRHLHMEPIAPTCSDFKFSQLWLQESQLDVITSSTFGGFGWIHASVHVENEANLFPGFASLGTDGNCYEQRAGVLKMEDLRLDKGANVKVTVGDQDAHNSFAERYECPWTLESIELGRYADCLIVDSLSIQGTLDIDIAIRSGLYLAAGESRCFPIIQYQAVEEGVLNNIHLKKDKLTSDDHKSVEGTYYLTLDADTTCNVVYLCVSTTPNPVLRREITIPSVPGITTYPVPGQYYVNSGSGFSFKAKFGPEYSREGEQLAVRTGRIIDGVEEVIVGIKNANGEYEYFIQGIRTNIVLTFGPDYVSADDVDGASVWSHDNMIYIRVDKEEIASIYLVTGQIVKQLSLSEGTHSVPTERGVYIVTLKDGSVHKVIVK